MAQGFENMDREAQTVFSRAYVLRPSDGRRAILSENIAYYFLQTFALSNPSSIPVFKTPVAHVAF